MFNLERLFENFFDTREITPMRLSNFGGDTIQRFTNANTDGSYTAIITAMNTPYLVFSSGISGIDTNKGVLKGKTLNVKNVMGSFGGYMSEYESEIAHAVGGFTSADYLAFYPHGVSEYSAATITQMPLLVKRINTLATDHAAELGDTITTQLQSFEMLWESVRTDQTNSKNDLGDGRADRGTARTDLEIALLKAIFTVALQFTGNPAKCIGFFDFGLLTGVSRNGGDDVPPAKV